VEVAVGRPVEAADGIDGREGGCGGTGDEGEEIAMSKVDPERTQNVVGRSGCTVPSSGCTASRPS
jgi:hypothetical protein